MLRLLLVRHGETAWNAQQRFQGHTDVPLSQAGRAQATALAELLRWRTIDAVYASDLRRASETAEILVRGRSLSIRLEPSLRELAFGAWEGLTFEEIRHAHYVDLHAWLEDRLRIAPTGGESLEQLNARLQIVRNQLTQEHADQTILIVAHGGPLQVLIATALGLPAQSYWQFRIDAGSLTELDLYPTGAILFRSNQLAAVRDREFADSPAERNWSNASWDD